MQVSVQAHCLQVQADQLDVAGVQLTGPIGLSLKAGRVYVLQGQNGVGKSTLLRGMANGLVGRVHVFKPEFGLRDELTVKQHLSAVLQMLGQPSEQSDELLQKVGLLEWQYEHIGTLSSGQRARLALCAMLAHPSEVWLLDEPLNALDQQGVAVMASAIQQQVLAGGFVVMASHVDATQLQAHARGLQIELLQFQDGRITAVEGVDGNTPGASAQMNQTNTATARPLALLRRELSLLRATPQLVLWGALFHWVVLSFFGIGLNKPGAQFAQVAAWVSVLLALMLNAKDWFTEDQRVGWVRHLFVWHPRNFQGYWLMRVLVSALANIAVLVPVSALVALQFGLGTQQASALTLALAAGLWASAPLLGLVALLVMLTRGGAVLVYLFALPLLVPVLIFGLEASQAADFGRSAQAPLAVLGSLGVLGYLLGPWVAQRLNNLLQE
ncbi:ATP-binding cassette domain-containing protein [Limnobacter sp.]|uniref:ATP-binding cassette domain-containing protein n=1 Tax=Limnobacter sp. TaxID=2003368 RepID=UPI003519D000